MGKVLDFKQKNSTNKNEIIWSLLNQDLLTCILIFGELIEIDLRTVRVEEIINSIVIEQLQEFGDYYWWLDEDSFEDDFKNSINDFRKSILNKSQDREQVISVFGNLLSLELEHEPELESEGVECWTLLNQELLIGGCLILEILGITPTGTNYDHLIDDMILSKLQEFIVCYTKKDEEELKNWIEDFKQYTLVKAKNKKLIEDTVGNLVMLLDELNGKQY